MSIHLEPKIGFQRNDKAEVREVRHSALTDRSAELAWLAHPGSEFAGNWVALSGDRVVSSGPKAKAVYDEARSRGIEVPFMAYISPHRDEPFAGGWLD